jgi:hypothetical protein
VWKWKSFRTTASDIGRIIEDNAALSPEAYEAGLGQFYVDQQREQ